MPPIAAIVLAASASGVPSTVVSLARGDDLLASTRAAGTLLMGDDATPSALLVAGTIAHLGISSFWTATLWATLPRRHTAVAGALAGLCIAALDLGLVGRRRPAIRALRTAPQLADHVAFGAIVGWCRQRAAGVDLDVHGVRRGAGTLAAL